MFIAINNAEVLGYTIAKVEEYPPIYLVRNHGTIYDIIVTSKHRRKGIGTKLWYESLKWFKLLGLERVELSIVPDNIESSSFWKKQGFQDYMHKLSKKIE